MLVRRVWPFLALSVCFGCKPKTTTTTPHGPHRGARVDLIPGSATALLSVDAAAFSERGYRELLPWLDDPELSQALSKVDPCYAGEVQTVALGGMLEGDTTEDVMFAAVLVGDGVGAPAVVECYGKSVDQPIALWAEDTDTLVVSSKAWAAEVRAKTPKTDADPLAPVLAEIDADADAWFAVRFPKSVDEDIRSAANWMAELAARSTDDVIKSEPTATPTRQGIGYVSGSLRLDEEGLEGRVSTTFETRESVDLAHAVVDIGFVLLKHFGSSPDSPSERLAHEFVLHTTISRSGDTIEARTKIAADVLADAAEQAHSTLDVKKLLGLGATESSADEDGDDDGNEESAARETATSSRSPSALQRKVRAAAGGEIEEREVELSDEDEDLVAEACEAVEEHVFPLEECGWHLRTQLQEDREAAEPMLRCVSAGTTRKAIFSCDPDGLLNPEVASERARERRRANAKSKLAPATEVLRAAFIAAKTPEAERAIYTEVCERMNELYGTDGATVTLEECVEVMAADREQNTERFEITSVCSLLHDELSGWMQCLSGD